MRTSINQVALAIKQADLDCHDAPNWEHMARAAARAMFAGIADKSLRTHIALAMFGEEGAKLAA